jgi:RNA polymerase sigma-70 factor (ECF subfamily)
LSYRATADGIMNTTDRQLIEETLQGRTSAYGELVRRHQNRLFTAMLYMTNCHSEAEDVTQEAFLYAFRHLNAFHGKSEFYTWIYRIAVRRALTGRRRRRPQTSAPDDSIFTDLASDRDDPQRPMQLEESFQQLSRAIAELDEQQRAVVILRDYEGFDGPTVAGMLGIPEGTVRSRLHRARNQLRRQLKDLVMLP